jgi:hypothetical protein
MKVARKAFSVAMPALIFLLISLDLVKACETAGTVRLQVRLLKYDGVGADAANKDAFARFHRILAQKIKHLKRAIVVDAPTNYLSGLSVYPDTPEHAQIQDSPGDSKISIMWEFYDNTLVILTGIIEGRDVSTEFYWGDLHAGKFNDAIAARWVFTGEDFSRVNDTHSMIVLAALGLDALRRHCPANVTYHIFSEADIIAKNLESKSGQMSGELGKLRDFISEQLKPMS